MIRMMVIFAALPLIALAQVQNEEGATDIGQGKTATEPQSEAHPAKNNPPNIQIPPVQVPKSTQPGDGRSKATDDPSAINSGSSDVEKELVQQTRIADYTEELVSHAATQMWVSRIGAALIFITLIFTAIAARAAQRSSKAAESAITQNRAWITTSDGYEPVVFDDSSPQELEFKVAVRNSGKTPANHVLVRVLIDAKRSDTPVLAAQNFTYGFLGGGDSVRVDIDQIRWRDYRDSVLDGCPIRMKCSIDYHTIYTDQRGQTVFEYEIASTGTIKGQAGWSAVPRSPDISYRVIGNRCIAT